MAPTADDWKIIDAQTEIGQERFAWDPRPRQAIVPKAIYNNPTERDAFIATGVIAMDRPELIALRLDPTLLRIARDQGLVETLREGE